jgi:hypothetical protein
MSDDEPRPEPVSFPRGGGGPPQALPRGANVVLVVVSLLALGTTVATLAWLFGV